VAQGRPHVPFESDSHGLKFAIRIIDRHGPPCCTKYMNSAGLLTRRWHVDLVRVASGIC
jgi:hypothetical protein